MSRGRQIEAGRAAVRIIGDDAGLQQTLRKTQTRLRNWGRAVMAIGAAATTGFATAAIQADKLVEAGKNLSDVFGEGSREMQAWAESFARSIGRGRTEIIELATSIGAIVTGMGVADAQARQMTQTMTTLISDLAAFNNTSADNVAQRLRRALSGSNQSLERYGVFLDDAREKQELLAQGFDPDAASEQQRLMARLNIIIAETAHASGAAAGELDSLAGRLRALGNRLVETWEDVGRVVLPRIEAIVDNISSLISKLSDFVAEHPRVVDALFTMAMAATAFGAAMQGVAFLLGPLGTMGAIFGGQMASDRFRERRENRLHAVGVPPRPRARPGSRRGIYTPSTQGQQGAAPAPSINSPATAPFDASRQRAAQVMLLQQATAGQKLNVTMQQQAQQVSRTSRAWSGLWNVLATNMALKQIGSLLGRRGLLGLVLRIVPALAGMGKGALAALAPLAALAGKALLVVGAVAGLAAIIGSLVYSIYKLPESFRVAVDLLDEWGQSNAVVAAAMSGLRKVFSVLGDTIKGWAGIAVTAFNAVAKGAVWAAGQLKDAFNSLTFNAGPELLAFFDAAKQLREQEAREKAGGDKAQDAAEEMRQAQAATREALATDDWDAATESAEKYVAALKENIEGMRENGVGAMFVAKRLDELAEAEQHLMVIRARAEGERRAAARREQMANLAKVQGEINRLGTNDQQRRIMAIESETDAIREQAREMGVLTNEIKQQLDAQEASRIADVINEPIRELKDELEQMRIQVDLDGVSDLERDLQLLKHEHEQAADAARQRGIEDEAYYDMLGEKYRLLAVQQRQMNDARVEGAERSMRQEIAHLEIEAGDLDGLDKRMAQLRLDFAEDLRRALQEGLDPGLVRRRYELLAQLAEAEFQADRAGPASAGTFSGRFAELTGDKVWQERLLDYTRQIARNTEQEDGVAS